MSLKQDMHDRLWRAFERWRELRATGVTKHDLKMRGLRECGDPNRHTRSLIFARETARTYEAVLKDYLEMAERDFGVRRLEDIGKREYRAFMDRALEQGLAAKTLHRYRSALSKLAALTGHSESGAALSKKYGRIIRERVKTGAIRGPERSTPTRAVADRAIEILREWDARHYARTDEPRAYHLAARVQLATSCRSVSATTRLTRASLLPGDRVELIGKGGRRDTFEIPADLHRALTLYLGHYGGPLADHRGYQQAYARAVQAAGGRVTGTHGLRRLSAQEYYRAGYGEAVAAGLLPRDAAERAAGDAVERLGHNRNRSDHRRAYLKS